MKVSQILEARYVQHKPDMRHVYDVSKQYDNYATNGHAATKRGGRESDTELWDSGRPSINTFGNSMADGFTGLKFIFKNTPEDVARRWVRDFTKTYGIPYTSFESFPPRELAFADEEDNPPQYTRVDIRYTEHPDS